MFVESICVFGSAARQTNDLLSDKDVLIVCSDSQRRRSLAKSWEQRGWSAAAYAPSQITGMIRHGSLFIQHLKREGKILSDNGGWLRQHLAEAAPKSTYKIDQLRSIDLIRPVERLGSYRWEGLLAADLAFVFFRNFGIYGLAERRVYEFDYFQVIEFLTSQHKLSNEESDILVGLRARKVAYRDRRDDVAGNFDTDLLINTCNKVLRRPELTRIGKSSQLRIFPLRFATLREVEAKLVAMFDIHMLDVRGAGNELGSIWRAVTGPREYSSTIRKIDTAWVLAAERCIRGRFAEFNIRNGSAQS